MQNRSDSDITPQAQSKAAEAARKLRKQEERAKALRRNLQRRKSATRTAQAD